MMSLTVIPVHLVRYTVSLDMSALDEYRGYTFTLILGYHVLGYHVLGYHALELID